jgi:hypothetical protein
VCGQWTLKNTQLAFEYAHYHWDHYNFPTYYGYENDCTDYVSQLLHAGGMPMLRAYEKGKDSWFTMPGVLGFPNYEPYHSDSWVQVEVLYHQLLNTGLARPLTKGEIPHAGDIVFFHWYLHGEPPIDHVGMIVSGNNDHPATEIYTSHTNNRLTTMEAEYKEIGKYLHERNKAIPASEYGRGKWWQWYVLRPIHLSAYVPPE